MKCQGSALMAVFWLVLMIGAAVVMAAKMLNITQKSMAVRIGQTDALAFAWTGATMAMHPEVKRDDPMLRSMNWIVRVQSEDTRINPMAVLEGGDRDLLVALFSNWGVDVDDADAIVDAIQDWVDEDDLPSANGAESDIYERMGRIGQPLNRPFAHLDEMAAVNGMELVAEVRPNWRDWFSVYSSGKINIAEANAEVIAEIGGFSLEDVQSFIAERNGEDGLVGTEDDIRFNSVREAVGMVGPSIYPLDIVESRFSVNGSLIRIQSTGMSGLARVQLQLIVAIQQGQSTIVAELSDG